MKKKARPNCVICSKPVMTGSRALRDEQGRLTHSECIQREEAKRQFQAAYRESIAADLRHHLRHVQQLRDAYDRSNR